MKPRKNIAYRLPHLLRGVGYSRRLSIRSLVLDPACKEKKIEISFKSMYKRNGKKVRCVHSTPLTIVLTFFLCFGGLSQ